MVRRRWWCLHTGDWVSTGAFVFVFAFCICICVFALLYLRDTGGAHGSVVEFGLGPILIQPAPTSSSVWESLRRSLPGIAQSCLVRSLLSWLILGQLMKLVWSIWDVMRDWLKQWAVVWRKSSGADRGKWLLWEEVNRSNGKLHW